MKKSTNAAILVSLLASIAAIASVDTVTDGGPTNDPLSSYQWGLRNDGQTLHEDLDDIHSRIVKGVPGVDIGISGILSQLSGLMKRDVVVAVLDSGVDLEHPEIAGSILQNTIECEEGGGLPFQPDEDKDGNGYKGDCKGWNFTADGDGDNRPYDDTGHGTHVAGIIAAQPDNSYGISGATRRVKILPVKVTLKDESGAASSSFTDRVTRGIRYAVKMKADVINLSLGWPRAIDTDEVHAAIREAYAAGVTIVAAAGNNRSDHPIVPCSYDEVICVGSLDADGALSNFSNLGGTVDLLAPGTQILSIYPSKLTPEGFGIRGFEILNGTSQAAPFVTAAVATLKGVLGPISNSEIRSRLILSSRRTLSAEENAEVAAGGLLQVDAALKLSPTPFVHPVFKGLSLVTYQMSDRSFSVEVPIRAEWQSAKNVVVEISSPNKGVKLAKTRFVIGTLKQDQSKPIDVAGEINDLAASSDFPLRVVVRGTGIAPTEYRQTLVLSRSVQDDSEFTVSRLEGITGEAASQIQTVTDRYRQLETPEYYVTEPVKEGLKLRLFRRVEGVYRASELVIPEVNQMLAIERLDLDGNGKLDYWIYASGRDKEKKPFLQLGYFDEALKPLTGSGYFHYLPEAAIPDLSITAFVPQPIGGKKLWFPLFVSQGGVTKTDRNPDPFSRDFTGKMSRIYYLLPDEKGETLITRLLDRYDWVEKVREDLHLEWDQVLATVSLGAQSLADFQAGKALVYLAAGSQDPLQHYALHLNAATTESLTPVETHGFNLNGTDMKYSTTIADDGTVHAQSGTAFFGFQSEILVNIAYTKPDGSFAITPIEGDSPADYFMGTIASYLLPSGKDSSGVEQISFFQSKSRIIAQLIGPKGAKKLISHPLHRSSFVPGKVFSELLTPIIVGSGPASRPALYIDSTQLQSGSVSAIEVNGGALVSTVRNTLAVPDRCLTLNPVRFGSMMSFALVCHEADGSFALRHMGIR